MNKLTINQLITMEKSDSKGGKSAKLEFHKRRVFSEAFKCKKVAEITYSKVTVLVMSCLWDVRS